jgi:hypothetical protein
MLFALLKQSTPLLPSCPFVPADSIDSSSSAWAQTDERARGIASGRLVHRLPLRTAYAMAYSSAMILVATMV